MRAGLLLLLCVISALGFTPPAAPNGPNSRGGDVAKAAVEAPQLHATSSAWSQRLETLAARLDDAVWGRRSSSAAAAAAAVPTPQAVDQEVLRRRAIRHSIVEERKAALGLECRLINLLHLSGGNLSKKELDTVHELATSLELLRAESVATAAVAAANGVRASLLTAAAGDESAGAWEKLHDGSAPRGVLRSIVKRAADTPEQEPLVTYVSRNIRIARGPMGELFVYQRLHGAPECKECATAAAGGSDVQWFWPL